MLEFPQKKKTNNKWSQQYFPWEKYGKTIKITTKTTRSWSIKVKFIEKSRETIIKSRNIN